MNDLIKLPPQKLFIEFLKDPARKSLIRISVEIFMLMLKNRDLPLYYFSRHLFKTDRGNIRDYFSGKFLYRIKPYFNSQGDMEVLENKLYFNFFYNQFNINVPKILMYNNKKVFVVGNSIIEVNNPNDFKQLLITLFNRSVPADSIIIKKTFGSFGGASVYKLLKDQLSINSEIVEKLYHEVIASAFLFQETIKQHSELDKLNPSCVNSIRFDTFIDKDDKTEIISAYIRMSINNLCVDNISSGGCQVGIYLENGRLKKEGFSSFNVLGTKILTEHPITNQVFDGFSIPFFQEAKELVLKAASLNPGLRLVGWDIAISDSGPVLIEGNSNYDASGNDLAENGYRTNKVFRKVLQELNYM